MGLHDEIYGRHGYEGHNTVAAGSAASHRHQVSSAQRSKETGMLCRPYGKQSGKQSGNDSFSKRFVNSVVL